jgi:uncharacterized protein YdhG (YjbR/CyaY superfamily)
MNPKPNSIQEYFSWFPPEIQAKLQQMREILRQALPEAEEVISYHMPAFRPQKYWCTMPLPKAIWGITLPLQG